MEAVGPHFTGILGALQASVEQRRKHFFGWRGCRLRNPLFSGSATRSYYGQEFFGGRYRDRIRRHRNRPLAVPI